MPLVSRRPAQPGQPRRFLMLHPLEHVRDHQNPLADTPALVPCQAPQLRRPRFAAKEVVLASPIPQTWYAYLITLPHLGIPGSRYYTRELYQYTGIAPPARGGIEETAARAAKAGVRAGQPRI